jgi:hypothetical protein
MAPQELDTVINVGGWLLLSAIFSGLLLVVQRAEQKRRLAALAIMAGVAWVVSGYGMYRIANECDLLFKIMCQMENFRERARVIASNTTTLAAFTAILFNVMFWVFIGRYNPPGSSDDIKVLGLND